MSRQNENVLLSHKMIEQYKNDGYLVLEDVFTEEELIPFDGWLDHFLSGKQAGDMRKDFCDMSQAYDTPFDQWQLVNAMLPSKYLPEMADNIFHRVSANIARQLHPDAVLDYEQLLCKKPQKKSASFAFHQDLGYWPETKEQWTATFSLALTDSFEVNGCLAVIPGTNREPSLRPHVRRAGSHALVIESRETDVVKLLPVKRGSLTIHDERIVHGSAGNKSAHWRKTYVAAYRTKNCVAEERALGFTHSHNDYQPPPPGSSTRN